VKAVNGSKGAPIPLLLERNGKTIEKKVVAKEKSILAIGIGLNWVNHPTPWTQFKQVISMTYKSLRSIFKGKLKMRHLSGPLGIFRGIAITYAKGGIMRALSLIVMITYSLAILNLMPLPVLDGGHIVLSLIQLVFGKPLSPKIVQPMFVIVIVLLFSMMLYVSFYDALRYISVTKEYRFMDSPVTHSGSISGDNVDVDK
jgi:regulator of sigma E protease